MKNNLFWVFETLWLVIIDMQFFLEHQVVNAQVVINHYMYFNIVQTLTWLLDNNLYQLIYGELNN